MDAVLEGDWEIDEEEEGEGKRRVREGGRLIAQRSATISKAMLGPLSAQVPAPISLPSMPQNTGLLLTRRTKSQREPAYSSRGRGRDQARKKEETITRSDQTHERPGPTTSHKRAQTQSTLRYGAYQPLPFATYPAFPLPATCASL